MSDSQRTKRHAFQLDQLVSGTSQQATHFAVLSFAKFNLQKRAAPLALQKTHAPKSKVSVGKMHALPQLRQRLRCGDSCHLGTIPTNNLVPGMRQ